MRSADKPPCVYWQAFESRGRAKCEAEQLRQNCKWTVRIYRRTISADGISQEVHVVVAREKKS